VGWITTDSTSQAQVVMVPHSARRLDARCSWTIPETSLTLMISRSRQASNERTSAAWLDLGWPKASTSTQASIAPSHHDLQSIIAPISVIGTSSSHRLGDRFVIRHLLQRYRLCRHPFSTPQASFPPGRRSSCRNKPQRSSRVRPAPRLHPPSVHCFRPPKRPING